MVKIALREKTLPTTQEPDLSDIDLGVPSLRGQTRHLTAIYQSLLFIALSLGCLTLLKRISAPDTLTNSDLPDVLTTDPSNQSNLLDQEPPELFIYPDEIPAPETNR